MGMTSAARTGSRYIKKRKREADRRPNGSGSVANTRERKSGNFPLGGDAHQNDPLAHVYQTYKNQKKICGKKSPIRKSGEVALGGCGLQRGGRITHKKRRALRTSRLKKPTVEATSFKRRGRPHRPESHLQARGRKGGEES